MFDERNSKYGKRFILVLNTVLRHWADFHKTDIRWRTLIDCHENATNGLVADIFNFIIWLITFICKVCSKHFQDVPSNICFPFYRFQQTSDTSQTYRLTTLPRCHYGEVYLLPIWVSAHRPRDAGRWLMKWMVCGRKWRWHDMRQAYFLQYLRRGSAKHAHFGLRDHIRRCDLSQTRQVGRLPSATFIIRQNVNPFH